MCSSAHDCSGWRAFMSEAKFADRIDNLVGQYRAMISFYHSVLTCGGRLRQEHEEEHGVRRS